MAPERGPEWKYVTERQRINASNARVECNLCGHIFSGGATRVKEHLLGLGGDVDRCKNSPSDINQQFRTFLAKRNESNTQVRRRIIEISPDMSANDNVVNVEDDNNTPEMITRRKRQKAPIEEALRKQDNLQHHMNWTKAFVVNGIPFNVIRNKDFCSALLSSSRPGFTVPPYNAMRTTYLDKIKKEVDLNLKNQFWDYVNKTGCTIAIDGWTNRQGRPLVNIMCIMPKGNVFLEAIDTSLQFKTAEYIAEIWENAILKVGLDNVTAICSDNAANYKAAGRIIEERHPAITWVPCAAHTLNLLLKDIGKLPFMTGILTDACNVVKFIKEHQYTWSLFRSKSNKGLRTFCLTRFATAYLVLERLAEVKQELIETVADRRWENWVGKHPEYAGVAAITHNHIGSAGFWRSVEKALIASKPFVRILRMVDTDKFVMGKLYPSMHEATEAIKVMPLLTARERQAIKNIADLRWEQMHCHLHGATFVLQPEYALHDQFSNNEVVRGYFATCKSFLGPNAMQIGTEQRGIYV